MWKPHVGGGTPAFGAKYLEKGRRFLGAGETEPSSKGQGVAVNNYCPAENI